MGNKHGFTEEELALLTEDERLGLEDDDLIDEGEVTNDGDDGEEDKKPKENAENDDESDDDAEGDDAEGDDDKKPDTDDKVDDENDDDGEGGEPDKADEKPKPQQRKPTPLIQAEEVADYDNQVKAIKDQKRELAQKFDDGELSTVEYQEQLDTLQEQQMDLRLKHDRAELSKQTTQAQEQQQWDDDCIDFLKQHDDIRGSQLKQASFNEVVKWLTAQEAAQGMTNQEQLDKSYEIWCEQLGIEPKSSKQAQPPKQVPETPVKESKTKNLPPNLGKIPAAEVETTDDGKFAYLDSLDGVEFENALSKLSQTEQEQYLKS